MSATPRSPSSRAEALAAELAERGAADARVAVVLGSGLGALTESLDDAHVIEEAQLSRLPRSTVPGHAGRIVRGTVGGHGVLVQEGRIHLYEGWSPHDVTLSMRAFAVLGTRAVLLTNAAGSLSPELEPGRPMRVLDHVSLQRSSPLAPRERGLGSPYDPDLGEALEEAARAEDIPLLRGVYAAMPGPAYETPAEIRMLRWMGADAVGMSTVAEACAAHAAGMRVAALSCLTNYAAGIEPDPLRHEDVVAGAHAAAEAMIRLLRAALPRFCELAGNGTP